MKKRSPKKAIVAILIVILTVSALKTIAYFRHNTTNAGTMNPSAVIPASTDWIAFDLPRKTDFQMYSADPRAEVCTTDLKLIESTGLIDCPRPWRVSQDIGAGLPPIIYFRGNAPINIYYLAKK